MAEVKTFKSIGGSNTHVVLEFPNTGGGNSSFLYMGSVLSLSYSTYRDKAPVFNCGSPTVDGFAIGNKYVAGSLITTMFLVDELSEFINENVKVMGDSVYAQYALMENNSMKEVHTFMKDDLTQFNIHAIFTSEHHEEATRIIIYGANFINNGQVMSVHDLITENTASFVAKDIREQHSFSGKEFENIITRPQILTASQLLS